MLQRNFEKLFGFQTFLPLSLWNKTKIVMVQTFTFTATSGTVITVEKGGTCYTAGSTQPLMPGSLLLRKLITASELMMMRVIAQF